MFHWLVEGRLEDISFFTFPRGRDRSCTARTLTSLVLYSSSTFLLVPLSDSSSCDTNHNLLHIFPCLLSFLATSFSSPTLLSFIYLHAQLLAHHGVTRSLPTATPYFLAYIFFFSSTPIFPLSISL